MVSAEEKEEQLFKRHTELCNKLSLDQATTSSAWESFLGISKNYVLEGDPMHWLGCSIYVASRGVETPTVDSQSVVKGNGLNLTSLLRCSNLCFAQFFSKITKWADMAQLSDEFKTRILHLDSTFRVAFNTFKELHPLFVKIFVTPQSQDLDQNHRSRRIRPVRCTSAKLLEFTWTLFITLKNENIQFSTDLVKSYHLLYSCLDLVFKNAYAAKRKDLLNSSFEAVTSELQRGSDPPCIVSYFCKSDTTVTDAIHMKVYEFSALMANLIENGTLHADETNFTGLLDHDKFEQNLRNISRAYNTQLLNKGEFDETIFLAEYKRQLQQQEQAASRSLTETGENVIPESPCNSNAPQKGCETPLTGRGFLGPREAETTPNSHEITRLLNIVNGRPAEPSARLLELFQTCQNDPTTKIQEIIANYGEKFVNAYVMNNQNLTEEANNRLHTGIQLFYKFIETILYNEKKIRQDISALVEMDVFYQCMFACCLELVVFCYHPPGHTRKFPWILDVLGIEAFHFVKVVELVVRSRDQLSREMIKHLNRIEETVMESLIWKSSSPIWQAISKAGEVPKFEDTALPGSLLYNDPNKQNCNNDGSQATQSPGPSATDCFQSPVANRARPSVVGRPSHIVYTDKDGNKRLIPIIDSGGDKLTTIKNDNQQQDDEQQAVVRPKKPGSLSIIFRKFYNLAGVRLEHLHSKLGVAPGSDACHKIWTAFEDSVRLTDLIRDRHLDQLLMCAVYVVFKVTGVGRTFSDIMKFYREQPQASSSVYRSVLINRAEVRGDGTNVPEKRGDLISFYNSKYVDLMKRHTTKFQRHNTADLILSPIPATKKNLVSPSIQIVGNVFVKPLEVHVPNSGSCYNYYFSRSPSKDLKDINKAINNNGLPAKRLNMDEIPNSKRRKIQFENNGE